MINQENAAQNAVIVGLGYLGLPLAQALYERDYALFAIKRHLTSDEVALPFPVYALDLNDENAWQNPLWHGDLPQHADWYVLLPPSPFNDYANTVAHLTAAAVAAQARCVVFASSISVYGDAPRDCDEHSPVAPVSASARAIVAAENILLNSNLNHIAILRLGGLYCAARHPLNAILRTGYLKQPHAPANMLHRDRAVSALWQAAQNASGQRIRNIVETPQPRRVDFYRQQAQVLGLPMPEFDANDTQTGKRIFSVYDTKG